MNAEYYQKVVQVKNPGNRGRCRSDQVGHLVVFSIKDVDLCIVTLYIVGI